MPAQYHRHREIDRDRWDAAVATDPSRLPYGLSWWLDAVTGSRWDGLVLDDYRAVLPLPYRWRIGRWTQVQRPPFTQQCGPFGQLEGGELAGLLAALPPGPFTLPFRAGLDLAAIPPDFSVRARMNLVLDFQTLADGMPTSYRRSLRRQLRRHGPAVLSPATPDLVLSWYRTSVGQKAGLRPRHYARMRRLMAAATEREEGLLLRADDPAGGLLAAGFFPCYRGRIINLFGASTPKGMASAGMARLLDGVIRTRGPAAGVLDFEGSDLAGVAEFFRGFGPEERPYPLLTRLR